MLFKPESLTKMRLFFLISSLILSSLPAIGQQSACPADFYDVPLVDNSKVCQLFNPQLPASMSYFVALQPIQVQEFYLNHYGEPDTQQHVKDRTLLKYADGQRVVIISKDGQGTQVDILIKST